MLQAADAVWVHICEPNILDNADKQCSQHGLLEVEQRPDPAVLRVRLLQGRVAGELEESMEEG